MNADNSIAPEGRDAGHAAPIGFELPSELARQYQLRVIDGSDGERRIGLFRPADRDNPSIEIADDHIVARREDPETVAALVTIAQHNGWDRIAIDGSPEFRQAIWEAASRQGMSVSGYEPSFAELARVEEARRAEADRRDRDADRENRAVAESTIPDRDRPGAHAPAAKEAERAASYERRGDSEVLAELFLDGGSERIAAEPRLSKAIEAQAAMEEHIGEVFSGDAQGQVTAALESRQMISDALRRGLDVTVREPTPVRQIEPVHSRPDLER